MNNDTICHKCNRDLEFKLQNGRWVKFDKKLHIPHSQVCADGLKFKIGDKVIAYWPKSVAEYEIMNIANDSTLYDCRDLRTGEKKEALARTVQVHFKLMDKMYELLYL